MSSFVPFLKVTGKLNVTFVGTYYYSTPDQSFSFQFQTAGDNTQEQYTELQIYGSTQKAYLANLSTSTCTTSVAPASSISSYPANLFQNLNLAKFAGPSKTASGQVCALFVWRNQGQTFSLCLDPSSPTVAVPMQLIIQSEIIHSSFEFYTFENFTPLASANPSWFSVPSFCNSSN